ncbi:MAG: nucleotidyltransferase family protein [Alphaproteobacteria bacterium]|nr:nucleotidyltransferase family protein [Alphaproteobacteria bacterium]
MSECILNREQAEDLIRKDLENLRDQYGVSEIALFGSVARDEAGSDSNVDILVDFNKPTGLLELISLKQHLEKLLEKEVDLATKDSLHSEIKKHVLESAIDVSTPIS